MVRTERTPREEMVAPKSTLENLLLDYASQQTGNEFDTELAK